MHLHSAFFLILILIVKLFFFILILIVNCSNKWTILINQTERVNPIAGHLTWHIFFSVFMKERNSNDLFFPCCPVVNLGGGFFTFFFVLNFVSVAMLIFFLNHYCHLHIEMSVRFLWTSGYKYFSWVAKFFNAANQ